MARNDGILQTMPNPGVLLSPLSTREAVLSSRIEGTQASMTEVLEFEAGVDAESPERREDIHEILNYRRAMHEAEHMLETFPMSRRVICRAHEVLLDSVRGTGKSPGEYRRVPNWIGPPGRGIEDLHYVNSGWLSSGSGSPSRSAGELPGASRVIRARPAKAVRYRSSVTNVR